MTHPRSGLAAASPSRGRHRQTGEAGSAVAARIILHATKCRVRAARARDQVAFALFA